MISIRFHCPRCGLKKAVEVTERGLKETLKHFVDRALLRAGRCHHTNSPRCPSRHMDLAIPMPKEGDRPGDSVEPNPSPEYLAKWKAGLSPLSSKVAGDSQERAQSLEPL